MPETTTSRRDELKEVFVEARSCTRCPQLAATRTQVVFGAGNADADLMFVGEAPGAREDERGLPFVGAAGRMLEELLASVGLVRDDVFIANVLKCRPPGNRDPAPIEISNCQDYLFRQVELIRPKVICTLGNFSTKLLRADPTGITRLHGRRERRVVGTRAVWLYPIHHPAAALYTQSLQDTLREDFARLPALLAEPAPDQPEPEPHTEVEAVALPDLVEGRPGVEPEEDPEPAAVDPEPSRPEVEQLGLF
jgi:DNA polymerase